MWGNVFKDKSSSQPLLKTKHTASPLKIRTNKTTPFLCAFYRAARALFAAKSFLRNNSIALPVMVSHFSRWIAHIEPLKRAWFTWKEGKCREWGGKGDEG